MYVLKDRGQDIKGDYKFQKKIGQPGQFGCAWLATKKSKGEILAVKVIKKERFLLNVSVDFREKCFNSLRNEITVMKKAEHKNIIQFEDCFEDSRNLYIAMEACTGGELFDYIQEVQEKDGFSEVECVSLLKQIFEGLHYLHSELKIAHCDLKPDNFLFKDKTDRKIKIIDFGMAKFVDPSKFFRDLCGTPYYIAPEVWKGNYSNACDMWSMGVIAFILLFGYPPFHGESSEGVSSDERIKKSILAGFQPIVKAGWGAHFPKDVNRSTAALDFVANLLKMNPGERMTAEEALHHRWMTGGASPEKYDPLILKSIKTLSVENNFKVRILENLVPSLTNEEIAKLESEFDKMDEDANGFVEMHELVKVFGNIKPGVAESIFQNIDVDGDGKISKNELAIAFVNRKISSQQERMWAVFNKMDLNGDGVLDAREVAKAFGEDEHLEELFKAVDKDGNGHIDYIEFLDLWIEKKQKEEGKLERKSGKNSSSTATVAKLRAARKAKNEAKAAEEKKKSEDKTSLTAAKTETKKAETKQKEPKGREEAPKACCVAI